MKRNLFVKTILMVGMLYMTGAIVFSALSDRAYATESVDFATANDYEAARLLGGGYALTGQLEGVGYASILYNAENGLPTSDANCILSDSNGYIWIGGYSGIIKYDGSTFERLDSTGGLTNGKAFFEDSIGRIWIGTNDNGVVVMDGDESTHYTYKEGLPSSTIRGFAEDNYGRIYIGTTSGICYLDESGQIVEVSYTNLLGEYVIGLTSDSNGNIYGNTRNGAVFVITDTEVSGYYMGDDLGIGNVTAVYADSENEGYLYIGTNSNAIYYGTFSNRLSDLRKIPVLEKSINSINRASGRIWAISDDTIGYLDENESFIALENIPVDSGLENMTEDYQGNLWFTSSRQGVMEIVTSNYLNLTAQAHLSEDVVNATCLKDGLLYIGTDKGLQIVDEDNNPVSNDLTEYIGDARIRSIAVDTEGNLWLCTYTNGLGLVCFTSYEEILDFNEDNGFISNGCRCVTVANDGRVLVGTNAGLAIIKDKQVAQVIGGDYGIDNTVFLTVEEGADSRIYVGTDGDGIYVIDGNNVNHLTRDDGLTSDVILRIKYDQYREVFWIITSNSVEYMRDGIITQVNNFPYTNNYDVYFDDNDNLWILSSYGIYCANANDLLENDEFDYKLYGTANGLPSVPTVNAFSALEDGVLYIACREGVSKVDINNYFAQTNRVRISVKEISLNDEIIAPDKDGKYTIGSSEGRIQIKAAVLNYTLTNPTIRMYLEGDNDPGVTGTLNEMPTLEYTNLKYGDYTLHIQLLDEIGNISQDESFAIEKEPRLAELGVFKILVGAVVAIAVGFLVWRIMTNTIVRRQYEEIRIAKDEAERANSAKSRFFANISHEIRTPINTIMGMDEMILRTDATDVPKEYKKTITGYANDIKNASENLLNLINDVLDISKIESGRMNLVEQEYIVADQIKSVVSMVKSRSAEKDLYFTLDVDETIPRRLYGDNGKIKQIILNLLTNAFKYTIEGGFGLQISVIENDGEYVRLAFNIHDTGIGIKPEDIDKLFDAFERVDEVNNSGIQGTGLGLNISKQFAQLLGGELTVESEYGTGTTFTFIVNQKIADVNAIGVFDADTDAEPEGPYVPQFAAPDAEILIVDDNPMNLNVIKGLLKETKMFLTTATSGEECIEKLRYSNFNVILLDHMMPGMDGLETLVEIRKLNKTVPVIALTANAADNGREFYLSHGFDDFLPKPIDGTTLEATIKTYLPSEIVMEPDVKSAVDELKEMPDDIKWINDVSDIDIEAGVKYNGGINSYLSSISMFYDMIDDNALLIENALTDSDIKLYTTKVHALKSSLRLVGATKLAEDAQALENAGAAGDMDYISENHNNFMVAFKELKGSLAPLSKASSKNETKEVASADMIADAISALSDIVQQMDYDGADMVISQVREYSLSDKEDDRFTKLQKALKNYDWDTMEELLKG